MADSHGRPPAVSGLQLSLLVFVALPLVVVAALAIRVGFEQANRFQETLLKSDLELIARAIQVPVGDALASNDSDALETALKSVFAIGRVYGASVFDVSGQRVAAAGVTEDDLTHSAIPGKLLATGEKREEYREMGGRRVFSHFLPLFDTAGQTKGFIQITRRHDDFTSALSHLTWLAWGLWGMLAVTIIGTVLLGHYGGIGRHVGRLLADMNSVGPGTLDKRVRSEGPREVTTIADGLNNMLDRIQRFEEEIGQRREEEQRLLLQLKDSEKMAAIGRITRGFAHELGAPLSVISGRARRLHKYYGDNPASRKELEDIRGQVQHLADTVRNLLEYSRPDDKSPVAVAVAPLLAQVETVMCSEINADGPRLSVSTDPDLPPVLGEPHRLQLAILNIVRNATQAAASVVEVHASGSATGVRICVSDDGPGLPDVERSQLLEPFFTTKTSGEGTGLGLSVTRSILAEYGGELHLGATLSGGCQVTLLLRAAGEESEHD